jgi:hypothetical protein
MARKLRIVATVVVCVAAVVAGTAGWKWQHGAGLSGHKTAGWTWDDRPRHGR